MIKLNQNADYVAVPRIYRLFAMEILDKEQISYNQVSLEDLPDGKYELSVNCDGKVFHSNKISILYTCANKEDLLKAIEKRVNAPISKNN